MSREWIDKYKREQCHIIITKKSGYSIALQMSESLVHMRLSFQLGAVCRLYHNWDHVLNGCEPNSLMAADKSDRNGDSNRKKRPCSAKRNGIYFEREWSVIRTLTGLRVRVNAAKQGPYLPPTAGVSIMGSWMCEETAL